MLRFDSTFSRAHDSFCCSKSHYAADKQRPLNDLLFREPNIIAAEISDIASVRPEESAPLDSRAQTRSVKPTLNFLQRFFPTSAVKNE